MTPTTPPATASRFKKFLYRRFAGIYEINEKYKTPRVTVTPIVSLCLLVLRIYLLLLVVLMFYKFFTLLK